MVGTCLACWTVSALLIFDNLPMPFRHLSEPFALPVRVSLLLSMRLVQPTTTKRKGAASELLASNTSPTGLSSASRVFMCRFREILDRMWHHNSFCAPLPDALFQILSNQMICW
jgi:hypothetical protein